MSSDFSSLLFNAPREFLVLNPTDRVITLAYDGETFQIPSNDQVLKPVANALKPYSGKNSNGEYIPGSLLLRDISGERGCPDNGNRGDYWSAEKCLVHCLRIDKVSKQPSGPMFDMGIAILPLSPAPELVERVREAGREKWKIFRVAQAQQTMADAEEAAQSRIKKGLQAPILGREHEEAAMIIAEARKAQQKKIAELMGTSGEGAVEGSSDEDLTSFARLAAEKAARQVEGEQPGVDRDALVDILMADPKFKDAIKAKYKMRKLRAPVAG